MKKLLFFICLFLGACSSEPKQSVIGSWCFLNDESGRGDVLSIVKNPDGTYYLRYTYWSVEEVGNNEWNDKLVTENTLIRKEGDAYHMDSEAKHKYTFSKDGRIKVMSAYGTGEGNKIRDKFDRENCLRKP